MLWLWVMEEGNVMCYRSCCQWPASERYRRGNMRDRPGSGQTLNIYISCPCAVFGLVLCSARICSFQFKLHTGPWGALKYQVLSVILCVSSFIVHIVKTLRLPKKQLKHVYISSANGIHYTQTAWSCKCYIAVSRSRTFVARNFPKTSLRCGLRWTMQLESEWIPVQLFANCFANSHRSYISTTQLACCYNDYEAHCELALLDFQLLRSTWN